MNNLAYVQKAVSKDKTRYGIQEVYRDKNRLVATDGHRLHWVNGLPDAEPHYLSGLDAQFPDYNQVIPTEVKGELSFTCHKSTLNEIAALRDFCKKAFGDKSAACKLITENEALSLKLTSSNYNGEVSLAIPIADKSGIIPEIGFSLNYFVDCLVSPKTKYGFQLVTMRFVDSLSPIVIEQPGALDENKDAHAIIMPLRFK
jgi:DNA polymerase III sliding clamp (beta) subunit (PCNA family)